MYSSIGRRVSLTSDADRFLRPIVDTFTFCVIQYGTSLFTRNTESQHQPNNNNNIDPTKYTARIWACPVRCPVDMLVIVQILSLSMLSLSHWLYWSLYSHCLCPCRCPILQFSSTTSWNATTWWWRLIDTQLVAIILLLHLWRPLR
jgi:hypothetical protein